MNANVPGVEADLLALATVRGVPLEVENGITAIVNGDGLQLVDELLVGGMLGAGLLDDDLGEIVVHLEKHVLVLAASLKLIVALDDLVVHDNTGRL